MLSELSAPRMGSVLSVTHPYFRATRNASLICVPADSMNVVGNEVSRSVSLLAIQMNRGEGRSPSASIPACR